MKLVDRYLSQAEECRKIAASADIAEHRRAIELMADTWMSLAGERLTYLDKQEREKTLNRH